jgi:hypothetical protein
VLFAFVVFYVHRFFEVRILRNLSDFTNALLHCDTIVVTGWLYYVGKDKGGALNGNDSCTDAFVRRDEHWRMVVTQ